MDFSTDQDEIIMLPGWSDAYSGAPSIVMDPEPMPALDIPYCERVSVLVQASQAEGTKPMPALLSRTTGKRYIFTKKLVQEKVRVLIMLARELEPLSGPSQANSSPPSSQSSCPGVPAHNMSHEPSSCSNCGINTCAPSSCSSPSSNNSASPSSPPRATAPSATATVWVPGEAVVIKVTDKNYLRTEAELIENPIDEISAMHILSQPGHEHVLPLLDHMQDSEYLYVVMPYLPGKDLFHKMKSRTKGLTPQRARRILREVITGLLYMKKHRIAHRDLSLENIMFDSKGSSMIIDFGMCVRLPQDLTGGCCRVLLSSQKKRGKASYVCPEIVREDVSDPFAADVWSLGVILFIMLTLTPLYQSPEDVAFRMLCHGQFDDLLNHYETLGVRITPCARQLIRAMLSPDPETRLTLEEILRHPWMMADDSSCGTSSHLRNQHNHHNHQQQQPQESWQHQHYDQHHQPGWQPHQQHRHHAPTQHQQQLADKMASLRSASSPVAAVAYGNKGTSAVHEQQHQQQQQAAASSPPHAFEAGPVTDVYSYIN